MYIDLLGPGHHNRVGRCKHVQAVDKRIFHRQRSGVDPGMCPVYLPQCRM
ncbi:hypothetical protein L210DRAFT_3539961 [Boletus edulis BED1]|uniref:Uncharacterized protein n=1 Tax=Boletus edulis BED1 TaxID=1328754 RepID=A0AAD4GFB0_BOLED|nr:hypothetical protein L210DRAFT_3539961 [Boletus edulis BED1]